jgi:hypothetical protein
MSLQNLIMKLNRRYYGMLFLLIVGVFALAAVATRTGQSPHSAMAMPGVTSPLNVVQSPPKPLVSSQQLASERLDLGMPERRVSAASR